MTLESLEIEEAPATLPAGRSVQLTVEGTFSDGSKALVTDGIAWSSSATSIATITGSGLLEAAAAGAVEVTATTEDLSAKVSVQVTNASLEGIEIDAPTTLSAGRSVQLAVEGTFSDGSKALVTEGIAWSSSATSVATITESGLLEAAAAGAVEVTATTEDLSAKASVRVTSASLEAIEIEPAASSLRITDEIQMVATAVYSDGSELALAAEELTWSVTGAQGIAVVEPDGRLTGQGVGIATVRAEHPEGPFGEREITVRPFAAEGTSQDPLTPDLPYRGEVKVDDNSFYRLTGLTPGEPYTIEIDEVHAMISAYGYPELPFQDATCGRTERSDQIRCALTAGPSGEAFLLVTGEEGIGSIYTIDVVPGGMVGEGLAGEPVDITNLLPYAGTVGSMDSYYVVGGLVPGAAYTVRLTDPSDDVTLIVGPNTIWYDNDQCAAGEKGLTEEECAFLANTAGEIHIRVYGGLTEDGASYTLDVMGGGLVDEGTILEPLDLTGALPHAGQVGTNWSYYVVSGLVPGATYTIDLNDVTDDVRLRVNSALAGNINDSLECRSSNFGPTASESCAGIAVNGALYIAVGGFDSEEGATFTLSVTPGGVPKEGYWTAPLDLTGALPHSGSVNGDVSFYVVGGLIPGSSVTVNLTGATDNVTLWTHEQADFFGDYCMSANLGTADESCLATVLPTGEVYIRVTATFNVAGVFYILDVVP